MALWIEDHIWDSVLTIRLLMALKWALCFKLPIHKTTHSIGHSMFANNYPAVLDVIRSYLKQCCVYWPLELCVKFPILCEHTIKHSMGHTMEATCLQFFNKFCFIRWCSTPKIVGENLKTSTPQVATRRHTKAQKTWSLHIWMKLFFKYI
jgi:hypothetical protein